MDWDSYYEKFYDWATSTQIKKMSSLTSFGASAEVSEVAQEYMDEKAASRLIKTPNSLLCSRSIGQGKLMQIYSLGGHEMRLHPYRVEPHYLQLFKCGVQKVFGDITKLLINHFIFRYASILDIKLYSIITVQNICIGLIETIRKSLQAASRIYRKIC